jgi:hypothetical protein
MSDNITRDEARSALDSIHLSQREVIDQIDMPRWYWWGVAVGWLAVGVATDLGNPWVSGAATLVFGAAHAAVAQHVLSGRHRSRQLSVRRDVVSRHVPALVIASLVCLALLTTVLAIAFDADGADHPVTIASLFAAVVVLCGGPTLMAGVRRRAATAGSR